MASDLAAQLRDVEDNEPLFYVPPALRFQRLHGMRRHVLNRMTQEKSGRLFCNDDVDFEIPGLEFYAAR